jgi:hypothetical protein
LAEIYADRYRSAFIITYTLGAFAVLAAFLGSYPNSPPPTKHGWFVGEFLMILGVLLLVALNWLGHWHERWIDYRLLAEGIRQMRVLAPFARVTPFFEVPAHLTENNRRPAWFNWYFRALSREFGLVTVAINQNYLTVCKKTLLDQMAEQVRYHRDNEDRLETLHLRLHKISIFLFSTTLLACFLHVWDNDLLAGRQARGILILIAIVFPAIGASIQGILHQAEFGRIARRSGAIKDRLENLLRQVNEPIGEISFRELGRATESFCEIQLLEQADWRSVFLSKEVPL